MISASPDRSDFHFQLIESETEDSTYPPPPKAQVLANYFGRGEEAWLRAMQFLGAADRADDNGRWYETVNDRVLRLGRKKADGGSEVVWEYDLRMPLRDTSLMAIIGHYWCRFGKTPYYYGHLLAADDDL